LLAINVTSFAQGIVRGTVTEDNGETLIGATVVIKNTTMGTSTDLDGNYSIKITSSEPQVLVFSFIGNKTVEKTVNPKNGKVVILNVRMTTDSKVIDEINVVAKTDRSTEDFVRIKARNAAVSMNYISKETIKKTGDSQVDDAMKRITGVSTVGGYISVRGLADRYLRTTINGSRIPTLDPLKNNIKLDLIPTSLIDNIIITKTISPDLPGDWAGSFVSIQTKDYPEKLMVNVKTTVGYNPQSCFTEINTTEKSSTDWLGFDNDFRDISTHDDYTHNSNVAGLSTYHTLHELMGDYMDSQGINADNFNTEYEKICFVELGLLAPNLIDDYDALEEARNTYYTDPEYQEKALAIIDKESREFGTSLPNNWFTKKRATSLNFSQDVTVGNQTMLFGKKLGYIIGLRYSSSVKNDPNIYLEKGTFKELENDDSFNADEEWWREDVIETNQWGALFNVAYQISPFHSFSFMIMPNIIGKNQTQVDSGFYLWDTDKADVLYSIKQSQRYEERQQILYQYSSSHLLVGPKIRIELDASYCDGQRNTPDFKTLGYGGYDEHSFQFSYGQYPTRKYQYLDEDVFDSRASIEIPLTKQSGIVRKLKFGGAHTYSRRENKQYTYKILGSYNEQEFGDHNFQIIKEEFESLFSLENFANGSIYYKDISRKTDLGKGEQSISAAYAMTDYKINQKFRISGGLRVEYIEQHTDITEFYSSNIPADVEIRRTNQSEFANPTIINKIDYLPSANVIYNVYSKERISLVLRSSFSKSLARPSLREVSNFVADNLILGGPVKGNSELKQVNITNYDLRLESYFKNKDNASISVFYKTFENHIEMAIREGAFSWINATGIGTVFGLEVEGRKQIVKDLEVLGNVSYMKSEITIEEGITIYDRFSTRPLYGQSPYIVNGTISYAPEKYGLAVSASYNIQGPKLALITTGAKQPDIYELPRHRVDFKISKKLVKHFSAEIKIRDLLGTKSVWAYDRNNFEQEYKSNSYGTDYSFSLSYSL